MAPRGRTGQPCVGPVAVLQRDPAQPQIHHQNVRAVLVHRLVRARGRRPIDDRIHVHIRPVAGRRGIAGQAGGGIDRGHRRHQIAAHQRVHVAVIIGQRRDPQRPVERGHPGLQRDRQRGARERGAGHIRRASLEQRQVHRAAGIGHPARRQVLDHDLRQALRPVPVRRLRIDQQQEARVQKMEDTIKKGMGDMLVTKVQCKIH